MLRRIVYLVSFFTFVSTQGHGQWKSPDQLVVMLKSESGRGRVEYHFSTSFPHLDDVTDWQPITDKNRDFGEVSHFWAYSRRQLKRRWRDGNNRLQISGGFEKKLNVCRRRRGEGSDVITRRQCRSGYKKVFSFFVSETNKGSDLPSGYVYKRYRYGTCRVHYSTATYARIVIKQAISCKPGEVVVERGLFYAFAKEVVCPTLPVPKNGYMILSPISDEDDENNERSLQFACMDGYTINGPSTIFCRDGTWSDPAPSCTKKTCSPPEVPVHALPVHGPFNVGALVQFECDEDYILQPNGSSITCLENGTWSQNEAVCVEVSTPKSCPVLDLVSDQTNLTCTYTEGRDSATCTLSCQEGYYYVSSPAMTVSCGPETNHVWSHQLNNHAAPLPICTREHFLIVKLAMSLNYTSVQPCGDLPVGIENFTVQMQTVADSLSPCQNRCSINNVSALCEPLAPEDSAENDYSKHTFTFDLLIRNHEESGVNPNCSTVCQHQNLQALMQTTFHVYRSLEWMINFADHPTGELDLEVPEGGPLHLEYESLMLEGQRPHILCPEGHVYTNRWVCVPCDQGTFLPDPESSYCQMCPRGTYQLSMGKTSCEPCLEGNSTVCALPEEK